MKLKNTLVVGILLAGILLPQFILKSVISQENKAKELYNQNAYSGSIGCTDIMVGKDASIDGSVITSHTGCADDSRIRVVPAQTFKKGDMAPVYWGIQEVKRPLDDFGQVIGEIPQVEKTHAYFHSGYPHMNEHQLGIAETTISQKNELKAYYPVAGQIMTIEQAQVFALERCKTAREALELITSLVE